MWRKYFTNIAILEKVKNFFDEWGMAMTPKISKIEFEATKSEFFDISLPIFWFNCAGLWLITCEYLL
jgi:hypothetical protein